MATAYRVKEQTSALGVERIQGLVRKMITNWWCHSFCNGRQCKIVTSTPILDYKVPRICLFNKRNNPDWRTQPTAICLKGDDQ